MTQLAAVRDIAHWLDARFRLPGTQRRFGLDPLVGLIPGVGDAVGFVLAGWIFVEAVRLGASRATLLRIAANVVIDAGVGAIPVLGDIVDFAWKANIRNLALLERHLTTPAAAARVDRTFMTLVISGVLLVSLASVALGIWLTAWLLRAARFG